MNTIDANAWIERAFSHLAALALGLTSLAMFLIHEELLDGMGACVMDIFVAPLCFGTIYVFLFGVLSLIVFARSFFDARHPSRSPPRIRNS